MAGETPVLSAEDAIARYREAARNDTAQSSFRAFYSSVAGGIVKDPELWLLPIDDHLCHRGHAVFDTCNVREGRVYGLKIHLDRLERSAAAARIPLPFPREQLEQVIVDTVAAAGVHDYGMCKYWLSAGRADFNISPKQCKRSSFYLVVLATEPLAEPGLRAACAEATVSVPLKPPFLATMKSNNYMLNALVAMEAEDKGGEHGLQITPEGTIAEGSICNYAFVLNKGGGGLELCTPKFDRILAGCTVGRALEIVAAGAREGELAVSVRDVTLAEVRAPGALVEMMKLGGSFVSPVTQWDGEQVGNGEVGPVTRAVARAIDEDMRGLHDGDVHVQPVNWAN
mmetsp:Transcript_9791/g.32088  ORF Transcript_9791/g.32088 Transcript_9791/m.32088 type:complete len:341 (+) Transcript_9791:556-1578(+)